MDTYKIFVFIHLLSVILGFGSAIVGDYLFMISLRDDKKIDKKELHFLKSTGRLVWVGLLMLILSGFVLFYMKDFAPLEETRVQAKMTLVAIVTVNGILFHFVHIPFLRKYFIENKRPKNRRRKFSLIFASGGLSFVSWLSIVILASWKNMTYKYIEIMIFYIFVVFIFCMIALLVKRKELPNI